MTTTNYTPTWITCTDIEKSDVIRFENSGRSYSVLTQPVVGPKLVAVRLSHYDRFGKRRVFDRRLNISRPVELIARVGGYDEKALEVDCAEPGDKR